MDFSKIIKTKTIKVNHSNFNKVKLQLKCGCLELGNFGIRNGQWINAILWTD